LKNQDFKKPYEVIVVDNNSTDATAAIARTARVKLIKETKRGAAAARNTGAAASSAPLLAFTDADSIVPSHWLSYISQSFRLNPRLAAVVGNFQFPHGNKLLNAITPLALSAGDLINRLITGSFGFRGANFAIKKKVFQAVGGFNPRFLSLEDLELGIRVGRIGQVGYLRKLQVGTSDRRFRRGVEKFIKDFIPIYISVALLNKPPRKNFPNIRN